MVVVVNVVVVVDVWCDEFFVCGCDEYKMFAGTLETFEIAGTLISFRSGKFGYSICPNFSKGHAKKFREFWHDYF